MVGDRCNDAGNARWYIFAGRGGGGDSLGSTSVYVVCAEAGRAVVCCKEGKIDAPVDTDGMRTSVMG
jgi:hypothetical protein